MRIIKKGKLPNDEKKKTCKTCNTQFLFKEADIHNDRDGRYVICPGCKKFIAV